MAERVTISHVLKYTGVFGGVQILKALAGLIRNKLTAILLGTAGMGLNAVFQNIGELIFSATNMGIPFSSTRNLSESYEQQDGNATTALVQVIRTWALWTALVAALICLLGAWGLDWYFFSDKGHSHLLEIMLLSLYVMSLPLEAAECAILKGTRQLKSVATVETVAAFGTILCTVPFYWIWGIRGVAVSLVVCGWMIVGVHACYTLRLYPYRVKPFQTNMLRNGLPLLRLGIPYMMAAAAGALSTSLIYGFLSGESEIGMYKAAYSMIVTYAGMAFVALDNDFFPRLAAINNQRDNRNYAINQQIQVCSMLSGVMMSFMVMIMPWLIEILLSKEFLPAVPMATAGAFYIYMRSVNLPLGYLSLARGESKIFLLLEVLYDILAVALVWVGYNQWGLLGCGIALSAAGIAESLILLVTYGIRYQFRLESKTTFYLIGMALLLGLSIIAAIP